MLVRLSAAFSSEMWGHAATPLMVLNVVTKNAGESLSGQSGVGARSGSGPKLHHLLVLNVESETAGEPGVWILGWILA